MVNTNLPNVWVHPWGWIIWGRSYAFDYDTDFYGALGFWSWPQ